MKKTDPEYPLQQRLAEIEREVKERTAAHEARMLELAGEKANLHAIQEKALDIIISPFKLT